MKHRKNAFNIIITLLAFLATVVLTISGAYVQEGYNIQVGSISPQKFVAPREVENKMATERKQQQALSQVEPLYTFNTEANTRMMSNLDSVFHSLDTERLAFNNTTSGASLDDINTTTQRSDYLSTVFLTSRQYEIYSNMTNKVVETFKESVTTILETIIDQGIKDSSETKSILYARNEINKAPMTSQVRDLAYSIISSIIEPNIIVDAEATEEAKLKKLSEIKPEIILKGQKIVDENDIITEEIHQILDSLSLINKNDSTNLSMVYGAIIILLLLFFMVIFYVRIFYRRVLTTKREMLLLFTVYILALIIVRSMISLPFYIIPLTLFTMLVAVLMDIQLSIIFNIMISIVGMLIYKGEADFFLFFTITGTVSSMLVRYIYERNKIVVTSVIVGVINCVTAISIIIFFDKGFSVEQINLAMFAALNGLLCVIITVGSMPIWEALYDTITPLKLAELVNPDKKLLRRLALEAPGTYHHSLIVANLSEMAASAVGANATLARAAGFYHDIGKLSSPQHFSENQIKENPHDKLEPLESTKIITNHVSQGLKLAEEFRLPRAIRDCIFEHHGTGLVKYFYFKAVKQSSKDEVHEEDYSYKGRTPHSKESAIVMLADTCEAAVRSMVSDVKGMDEIDAFVQRLIKDKLDTFQLDESQLTIKDLETIRISFMGVFKGMYHQRIAYPKE